MEDNRVTLAGIIVKRTQAGSLNWKQSDADDVQVTVGTSTIVLSKEYDGENDTIRMVFRVYNADGAIVETFSDGDLSEWSSDVFWFVRLSGTYDAARRNALGADKLIDEIVGELTKTDPDDDIPF